MLTALALALLSAPLVVPEVDALEVIAVVDNTYDCFQRDEACAVRHSLAHVQGFEAIRLQAEMGLAYLVRATVGTVTHTLLFDFALSAGAYRNNLSHLGLEIARTEALVLSHAHEDHYAALPWAASKTRAPIYVGGSDVFLARQFSSPKSTWDMGALKRAPLDRPAGRVVEASEPRVIAESALLSGKIPQVTPFEKVPAFLKMRAQGEWVQDPMHHELAVAFKVRGKGLVVLTSCAHSGVINTLEHMRAVSGEPRIHAVIGGMHLTSANDDVVSATVKSLLALSPAWVAPMHCTGDRAMHLLQQALPKAYVHPSVGTRYTFSASTGDGGVPN